MANLVGIDIQEIERFEKLVERGDRFAQGVLTEQEFAEYLNLTPKRKAEYLGGRFCIKEAFSKAYGTGLGKELGLKDVQTLTGARGEPITTCQKFSGQISSSIAHDRHEVVAIVLLAEG